MAQISQHKILLHGDSFAHCKEQVQRFFDRTTLVIYDSIQVTEEKSSSGLDSSFWQDIAKAEKRNRNLTAELIKELKSSGFDSIDSLQHTPHGYESKLLHILSHMLDGFIGIDSYFYNLLEDSHWLSEQTAKTIKGKPGKYWLLHLDCFADTPEKASILHK